jgi:hypothetical protein
MFPQQPQQQFRVAGADVKLFYGPVAPSNVNNNQTWNKPVGVSHVYMMLIGGGGGGFSSSGGNSGNVTVWYGAAQNVPDNLIVSVGHGGGASSTGSASSVQYRGSSLTNLLIASGGNIGAGANTADAANQFANSGFYQNTLGQLGAATSISASATTFLSGGGVGVITGNYGYAKSSSSPGAGFFQLQPIIVGVGGDRTTTGGIGCGGGSSFSGGPGLILIASW